jgi:hypothetical protein
MSDDLVSPISSKCGEGQITEQPLQPPAQERQPGRLASDAALKRRQERLFGPALFAADSTWNTIGYTTGFCSAMYPLRKQIQRRALRHRASPAAFSESIERLIQKQRKVDPVYERNFQIWMVFCNRLQTYLQEPRGASPTRKLSKDQKRQHARMIDLVELLVPLGPSLPSEQQGKKLIEILTSLGKAGRGRKIDPDSEKIIELYDSGKHGYGSLAKAAWPELWQRAEANDKKSDNKRLLKDRARQIIRRHKTVL